MSETLNVGDQVVCTKDGRLITLRGVGVVTKSDLSSVTVQFGPLEGKLNAGTLKWDEFTVRRLGFLDIAAFNAIADAAMRDELNKRTISDLQCHTCLWWRPPFTVGPGNCHNHNLIALTRANDDGFPPPTPATFGCVHWETKEEPENGDNSDE